MMVLEDYFIVYAVSMRFYRSAQLPKLGENAPQEHAGRGQSDQTANFAR